MFVKFLTSLSIGFIVGILVYSVWFAIPIPLSYMVIIAGIGVVIAFIPQPKWAIFVGIALIGVSLGLVRFSFSIDESAASVLDRFAAEGERITIHGTITSDPVETSSYTEFTIASDELVTYADLTLPAETGILVRTSSVLDLEYGQEVIVQGKAEKPDTFETDTGRNFDYASYLAKDGTYYTMSFVDVMVFDEGAPSIKRSLYHLKNRFLAQIYHLVPEPESGLLAGVLFGEPSALDQDTEDQFRTVGLMHIVVLSGYNVALVIQIVTRLLAFLPRGARSLLAVLAICGFALLVGAGPTVVRASIMAVFIVLADVLRARCHITRALVIAGIFMVAWNPMLLYFDVSFQLSFLATLGLIWFTPYLEKKLSFLPTWLAVRDSAVATIAAQIAVLPLILYQIGQLSIISPIVNVLVLFAVPFSMLFGFLTAALGMVLPILATPLAVISTWLFSYQLWVVDFFAGLPFASVTVPPFSIFIMLCLYALIGWWAWRIHRSITSEV